MSKPDSNAIVLFDLFAIKNKSLRTSQILTSIKGIPVFISYHLTFMLVIDTLTLDRCYFLFCFEFYEYLKSLIILIWHKHCLRRSHATCFLKELICFWLVFMMWCYMYFWKLIFYSRSKKQLRFYVGIFILENLILVVPTKCWFGFKQHCL